MRRLELEQLICERRCILFQNYSLELWFFLIVLEIFAKNWKHLDVVNKFQVTNGLARTITRTSMRILEETRAGALVGSAASPMAN